MTLIHGNLLCSLQYMDYKLYRVLGLLFLYVENNIRYMIYSMQLQIDKFLIVYVCRLNSCFLAA